jgi:Putative MetA-pathway of phenol degradation
MLKRVLVSATVFAAFSACNASAQGVCPLNGTASNQLVCVLPQLYGPSGLGSGNGAPLLANGHQAHFEGDFLSSFGPINEAVGIQVSQLPIASPASGILFVYDASLKTFAPSTEESLGPILGERAATIGRRKLYLGFSYQYFNFNSIDGQNISKLPAVFKHRPFIPPPFSPCPNQTGLTGAYAGSTCFVRDYIDTTTNIDLTVSQYTLYATYGITNRLDVSVVIPLLDVHMGASSTATIVSNYPFAPNIPAFPGGVFHQFDPTIVKSCGPVQPCLTATFPNAGTGVPNPNSASGIGDVVFRGKYEVYRGERAGIALGLDVRAPSGDATNFLGSGAWGFKPFGIISYSARVSPHAVIGYEVNGQSILAGNIVGPTATNAKGSLPNRFVYTLGADVVVVKRLTASFDFYGQRLFGVPQLFLNPYTDLGKCGDANCTQLTPGTVHADLGVRPGVDYNILNGSVGIKYRAVGKLVLTGNVLLKMNDSGLRATAIPLVGVSYSF